MDIKNLPRQMLYHLNNKIEELSHAMVKANMKLPEHNCLIYKELTNVMLFSEFAATTFIRNPALLADLIESGDLEISYPIEEYRLRIDNQIKRLSTYNDATNDAIKKIDNTLIKQALARVREREMVRIAWQDITGRVTLEQTLKDLSSLAEACVDKAITFIYDELCSIYGTPLDSRGNVQQLIVLGMGKLGAGELNFSSDIDLIFAYPEDALFEAINREGKGLLNTTGEFFTKMCKNFLKIFDSSSLISTMGNLTIFRVDTRLRPFGANGPIVMSFSAIEEYYQTQGREWERYALIKARPIAGDINAGYHLLKILNPFVYRRYFDYGSFDALREMKARISLQVRDKRFKNNIKLGAGGIREIEFFGQVFQLIRGGVEPEFQELQILKILNLLVQRNCIDSTTGKELTEAYIFLRRVENRLQEYNDLQTHDIPEKEDEKLKLAFSMGFDQISDSFANQNGQEESYAVILSAFNKVLYGHIKNVHAHFRKLFASETEDKNEEGNDELRYIWQNINDPQFETTGYKIAGFEDSSSLISDLKIVAEHPNTKKLTTNGRKRLDRLIPLMVHKIGNECDSSPINIIGNEPLSLNPETVLKRLVDLVIAIERRTCYLSLLIEKPQALDTLVKLASKSPWVISFLSLHPVLLDELLAPSTLYTPPDRAEMEKDIERRMANIPVEDFEFQLEELCIFKQVMMLRVAAADLSGNYPLMKVSDRLTEIAETVMNKVIEISWNHTVQKYGFPSGITASAYRGNNCYQNLNITDAYSYSYDLKKILHEKPSIEKSSEESSQKEFLREEPIHEKSSQDESLQRDTLQSDAPPLSTSYSITPCSQFFSPGFAAIAYGKLGGIELGYKSDLDMVFIYSGKDGSTEGGPRSIENIRYYTFLGQRIISALTLNTQAGKLYEADMRLRPNGQSGMIVSHIDAFHDYIKNEAWTWEHQAIIRARPIGGDLALQNHFNAIRKSILTIKRESETLKREVREMRERMRKEHLKSAKGVVNLDNPEPDLFDLKQDKGGIIDIEFLVQYLVLQYASDHPALTLWSDNVRLLETLAVEKILAIKEAQLLKQGYLKLRQMVHHLNLQERKKMIPIKAFKDEADAIFEIFEKCLY